MTDFQPLTIGSRAYKYIKMGAVKNVYDGLIELMTNAHDAYGKDSTLQAPHEICVGALFENKKSLKQISVVDRAIGLTSEDAVKCFLIVGDYTSHETSRGFFSRGAKDVSNIGHVTFETIKNGLYSKVEINTEGMGRLTIGDQPVTDEIRNSLKILNNKNGLKVTVDLLRPFMRITPTQLRTQIRDNHALRDILIDPNFHVCVDFDGRCVEKGKCCHLNFSYPDDKQILVDSTYNLAKYDNAEATLKIYSTNSYNPDQALLVRSDTTVYCKTIFDRKISGHPYIKRIFGTITCNKIHDMLYDIEVNGQSEKNPYCLLDHSRGGGLVKTHPFVKELYLYPRMKLLQVLQQIEDSEEQGLLYQSADINDLLNQLNLIGNNFDLGGKRQYSWRDERTNTHMKVLEGVQEEYIRTETNYEYKSAAQIRKEQRALSTRTNTIDSGPTAGTNSPPQITIYERDAAGEIKKMTILENGTLVQHVDGEDQVTQEPAAKEFKIVFSDREDVTQRYDVYETDTNIVLRIYTNEQLLNSYLYEVKDTSSLTADDGKLMLSEIIIEAFSGIMTKNEMELNAEEYDDLNTSDMLTTYQSLYNTNVQKIELLINQTINSLNQ